MLDEGGSETVDRFCCGGRAVSFCCLRCNFYVAACYALLFLEVIYSDMRGRLSTNTAINRSSIPSREA